jgi:hypothetical protein
MLWRYAGLGMQLFVSLAVALIIGWRADLLLQTGVPLFILLLPVAVLILMIYRIVKETSKPKQGKNE